jgi:hypothetical protein
MRDNRCMAVNNPLLIRIAAEASRDPRTVRAVIEGRGSPMARAAVQPASGSAWNHAAGVREGDARRSRTRGRVTSRPLRPRATAAIPVAPVTCSDLTAPVLFGFEPRPFREFLRVEGVPHETANLDALDGPLYFGIDPAGGRGGDKSAIVARRGSTVLAKLAFNGATDQIVSELDVLTHRFRMRATEPYAVNFDGSSTWGADLSAALRLRQAKDEAMTWHALEMRGDKARSPILREARCARLIDAYYLNLSIRLRTDAAIPFDEELRVELLFAEWREDQEDGTKLISKREYRKQLGRSPDLSDALAFCFWEGRVAPASAAAQEYRAQRRSDLDEQPPAPAPVDYMDANAAFYGSPDTTPDTTPAYGEGAADDSDPFSWAAR